MLQLFRKSNYKSLLYTRSKRYFVTDPIAGGEIDRVTPLTPWPTSYISLYVLMLSAGSPLCALYGRLRNTLWQRHSVSAGGTRCRNRGRDYTNLWLMNNYTIVIFLFPSKTCEQPNFQVRFPNNPFSQFTSTMRPPLVLALGQSEDVLSTVTKWGYDQIQRVGKVY